MNLGTLLEVYIRSFFFQGSFSSRFRQNLGFACCLEPVGKKLWKNPADLSRFYLRHTEDYNGNPFMAPLVLGAVAKMEERVSINDGVTFEDIRRFKKAVGPATGSAGDRFFWSNLRPFGLLAGIMSSLFIGVWGALVFLAVFLIPTLVLKWHWLITGYRLGPKVVYEIKNEKLISAVEMMETAGSAVAAFIAVVFAAFKTQPFHGLFLGAAALFAISFFMLKNHVQIHIVFPLMLCIALLVTALIRAV